MAKLSVKNISKTFGGKPVIDNISMDIADKEFVVLVGPSGCGKTTLLRIIAGLEEPTGGQILINDKDYTHLSPQRRNISMVFQSYALFPHMNVYDNISYGLRIRKLPPKEIEQRVHAAADTLNLREQLNHRPAQLSGGQRQRVAMGRALVRNPDLFLFDEPLSNLDAKLRMHMRSEIKTLHQKFKNTIVYVTHDQVEAMTLADTVVVMNKGVIAQQGAPIELYDKPNNLFVAGFIGSPAMNFMHGTLRLEAQGPVFRRNAGSFLLPDAKLPDLKRNKEVKVILGVRPEDFSLSPVNQNKKEVTAQISMVEHTGSQTAIHCITDADPLIILSHRRENFQPGDKVCLGVKTAHLFSPHNQKRLGN